ncbi:dual specificity protein phosphatase 9 [Pelomyxa schiedti]|nr:dual specificity protein phosphatase 9 [Pelomyxa schiedti]
MGITHVLSVMAGAHTMFACVGQGGGYTFVRKAIQVQDLPTENLLDRFPECNAFIEDALFRGAVLVHCSEGVSRSATVVMAYLMWKHHISYEMALQRLRSIRPMVYPNGGFVTQLKKYEKMLSSF